MADDMHTDSYYTQKKEQIMKGALVGGILERSKEIPKAFERLEQKISILLESVDMLNTKLLPLVNQNVPMNTTSEKNASMRSPMCNFAGEITDAVERIERATATIQFNLNNLEI